MFQPWPFRHSINKNKTQNKRKRQKWSIEEFKEILYCFYYALENPSKTRTAERTYKSWRERNKIEREYIDTNKLANVRRYVLHKKRTNGSRN